MLRADRRRRRVSKRRTARGRPGPAGAGTAAARRRSHETSPASSATCRLRSCNDLMTDHLDGGYAAAARRRKDESPTALRQGEGILGRSGCCCSGSAAGRGVPGDAAAPHRSPSGPGRRSCTTSRTGRAHRHAPAPGRDAVRAAEPGTGRGADRQPPGDRAAAEVRRLEVAAGAAGRARARDRGRRRRRVRDEQVDPTTGQRVPVPADDTGGSWTGTCRRSSTGCGRPAPRRSRSNGQRLTADLDDPGRGRGDPGRPAAGAAPVHDRRDRGPGDAAAAVRRQRRGAAVPVVHRAVRDPVHRRQSGDLQAARRRPTRTCATPRRCPPPTLRPPLRVGAVVRRPSHPEVDR